MARLGVVFDLYETLVTEFDPEWTPPSPSIAARLGISEKAMAEGWARVRDARMRGVIDFPEALRVISRFAGAAQPAPSLIEELMSERLLEKAHPFEAVEPRIHKLLVALRDEFGAKLGLMTNASEEETRAWHTCRLARLFDVTLFSYEGGFLKPEREFYDAACSALGVYPHEIVFIGDGGSDELVGAANVGFRAYWATWFLDRWPAGRHAYLDRARAFQRLTEPEAVVGVLVSAG